MANLLSTNVSGRLYTSGHVDTNTVNAAFRFYDGSTFRGGLGLDDWAHSGSANDITLYVTTDSSFYVSTSGTKRLRISSGEARFMTYSPDTNYNIRVTGGDQFNAYYGENATTLYINWNGGATRFGGELRAPIFYDSDNTGYYLDPNGGSNLNDVTAGQFYVNGWFRNNSINSGLYQQAGGGNHFYAEDSNIWTIAANGSHPQIRFRSGGHQGAIRGYVYSDTDNYIGFLSEDGNWVLRTWNRGVEAYGSMRAPIYYDSNDTTYYLDPNSTVKALNIAGNIDLTARSANWAEGIRIRVPSTSTWGGIRFTRDRGNDDGNWAIGFTGIDATDDLTFWGNNGGAAAMKMRIDQAANLTVYGSMAAPIFYDSQDTGYYLDPNSSGVALRISGAIQGNHVDWTGDHNKIQWHSDHMYFQNMRDGFWIFRKSDGAEPFQFHASGYVNIAGTNNYPINITGAAHKYITINPGNGYEAMVRYVGGSGSDWYVGKRTSVQLVGTDSFHFYSAAAGATVGGITPGGDMYASGSMRAPIFYDSADTNYYLDPAGYSRLSRVHPRNLGGATLNEHSTNVGVSQSGNWEKTTFIDGSEVLAHVSTGNGNNGTCYNWFNTEWVSVDPNKDYEFSVWVKSTGNDNIYMGWHERNASEGTLTSNPYFHTGKSNTNGTWIKLTARLKGWQTTSGYGPGEPDRYASSQSMLSWLPSGGESVDGVMHETTAFVHMRCGTCYGTVSGSKTYFYAPRIREITYDEVQNHIVLPYYNGSNWGGKLRLGYNDWGYYGIGMYGAAGEFRMSSDSGDLNLRVDGWIIANNYVQSASAMYSPIYYDGNDYNYYLDPNSTSNLASLNLNGDLRVSDGNRIWLRGSSSGSAVGAQTYIFGDGLNLKIKGDDNVQLLGDGENVILHASYLGRVGINTELPATALDVNGPAAIRGTNRLYWGHSSENLNTWTTAQYSSGSTHFFNAQEFRFTNEGYGSSIFAVINSAGIYAPVFYDYDNGNYYLNPSGGSRLGNIYDDGGETYGTKYFYSNKGATTSINAANTPTLQAYSNDAGPAFMSFHRGGYYAVNFGLDNDNVMRIGGWSAGYNRWTLDMDGNNTVAGSVTASGFYDSSDTAYHLDPANSSLSLNVAGYVKSKFTYRYNSAAGLPNQDNPVKTATGVLATLSGNGGGYEYVIIKTRVPQDSYQMGGFTIDLFARYGDTNGKTTISLGGYWNPEGNSGFVGWEYNTTNPNVRPDIQVMRDITDGSTCFAIQISKSYPIVVARDLYLGYNTADIEGWLDWSIFGADDLGNYTNNDYVTCRNAIPADQWYGNTYIHSDGRHYGTIFYDTNDTSYYVDPNGTSRLHIIKLSTDQWNQSSDGYNRFYFGNNARTYFGSGNGYEFRSAADANIASISNAGDFVAAGDVTAYSDARVKENVHTIENALDKTLQLRGVTYNRTDSEDKSTKVGVIAQEILEVIPEVVKQNDEGMYSVSYGNLTAVLIEAIKEQQKQIDELKEIINGLTK